MKRLRFFFKKQILECFFSKSCARFLRLFSRIVPKGLYRRTLLITVGPLILLQLIVTYAFTERHWQQVTSRLSSAFVSDLSFLIGLIEASPESEREKIQRIANQNLKMKISFSPVKETLSPRAYPFYDILSDNLSRKINSVIHRPFFIDTMAGHNLISVSIQMDDYLLKVVAHERQAYASNAHIFLVWVGGTSVLLVILSALFLRNQIRPILRLAEAAESFGKGRPFPFRPRGAREVRQAGAAFLKMRERIEKAITHRTILLGGVSHDLRTVLTRFQLSLSLLEETPEILALMRDVNSMKRMLEDYLSFARDGNEEIHQEVTLIDFMNDVAAEASRHGFNIACVVENDATIRIRPLLFRRLLENLIVNASRFGERVEVKAFVTSRHCVVVVDDDGPGIPEAMREAVFSPFNRLDDARNQNSEGAGLGLTVVRDVARVHGGDVTLKASPLGGVRAWVEIPL